jgi:hypothetical protein
LSLTESEQCWRFNAGVVSLNRKEVKALMENTTYEIRPVNAGKIKTPNTEGVDKWCIIDYGSGDDDNCGIDY